MRKWFLISVVITIPMFVEDFLLFFLGRYTTIPVWGAIIGIILLGLFLGAAVRIKQAKQFLGE